MNSLHESLGGLPTPPASVASSSAPRGLHRIIVQCSEHGPYVEREETAPGAWVAVNPRGCPGCVAVRSTQRLLAGCNLPPRFADATFDNFIADDPAKANIVKVCRDYAANFRQYRNLGRGLILSGDVGTGKNHLASALFKELLKQRFTALRVKATEYLDAYWAKSFDERDAWLRGMARIDLLMIDEVGRASGSGNAQNAFFRLIDARYENTLPTMITTNCDQTELAQAISDAGYDRLRQGGTKLYTLNGPSFRAKAHEVGA